MQKISDRLRIIRLEQDKTQTEMAVYVGIPQRTWSNYEGGKTEIPVHVILRLENLGYPISWIIKGEGNPDTSEAVISNGGGSINALWNAGSVGNNNVTVVSPSVADEDIKEENYMELRNDGVSVFRIPLLTKEQVLHFDPEREIPDPKAHSGDYPKYTLAPMPRRFQDYSTDLRAMVVFNGLMVPLLAPGDVAIFQATGWNGDGVYVYRVNGDLHISHVRFAEGRYFLTREAKPSEAIPCDVETFGAIGRVRAVVREIG
jgi:transcriptional regulator with XRE-family HTH domain